MWKFDSLCVKREIVFWKKAFFYLLWFLCNLYFTTPTVLVGTLTSYLLEVAVMFEQPRSYSAEIVWIYKVTRTFIFIYFRTFNLEPITYAISSELVEQSQEDLLKLLVFHENHTFMSSNLVWQNARSLKCGSWEWVGITFSHVLTPAASVCWKKVQLFLLYLYSSILYSTCVCQCSVFPFRPAWRGHGHRSRFF